MLWQKVGPDMLKYIITFIVVMLLVVFAVKAYKNVCKDVMPFDADYIPKAVL